MSETVNLIQAQRDRVAAARRDLITRLDKPERDSSMVDIVGEFPVNEQDLSEALVSTCFRLLGEQDVVRLYYLRDSVASYVDACGGNHWEWYGMGSADGNAFRVVCVIRNNLFRAVEALAK